MRYYIADLHFNHGNMNKNMDKRGFESAEAMNEYMIKQWNSKVKTGDEVAPGWPGRRSPTWHRA